MLTRLEMMKIVMKGGSTDGLGVLSPNHWLPVVVNLYAGAARVPIWRAVRFYGVSLNEGHPIFLSDGPMSGLFHRIEVGVPCSIAAYLAPN